jgi:hypothetical protein
MDENGELQTDNKIKAELPNKFFQSVFTIEDTTQGIPIFPPRTDQKLDNWSPAVLVLSYVKGLHLLVSKYLVFS